MARRRQLLATVAPIGIALIAGCAGPGAGKTAYVGAQVFDGTGGPVIANAVILVAEGRIEAIASADALEVPRGAAVVQLDGRWVIPGLVDAHTHAERWTLARFLAYGVTSIRDAGGIGDSVLALRDVVVGRVIDGPRMYVAGAVIDRAPVQWPGAEGVRTPEQGRRAIDQLALADAALAKVSPRITRSLLRAITDEAAALELPVAAHLGRVDALTASRLGVNAIEHMTGSSRPPFRTRALTSRLTTTSTEPGTCSSGAGRGSTQRAWREQPADWLRLDWESSQHSPPTKPTPISTIERTPTSSTCQESPRRHGQNGTCPPLPRELRELW